MKRFKNILAHVDLALEQHTALARGVRLARHNNAKLTAMTVIEEHPAQARAILRSLHLEDTVETIERDYREQLEQLVQPVRDAGLDVDTVIAHGSTFVELIRATLQRQHDLTIKTVGSEGTFHRTFFGSTDMHLLRKCPTPLWLLKPGEPDAFRRILVPLDPNMEPKRFDEYVRTWGQESSNRAWRFISAFGRDIKPKSLHLVQGEPGFEIPRFVKDHDAELVVMGTLGRLGQHGLFIGDTAERILNRLECSVLAVKPAGFVSPVH